jgi:tyrosine-protein kinase Etk/Wzc
MGLSTEISGQRRPVSWGAVVRNRWIILVCTVAVVAISVVLTQRSLPVYRGASTLRIEQKQSNLPEAFRTPSSDSRLPTEMEELRSRALAEDVVRELGLRLVLIDPKLLRRSDLLREVRVSDSAAAAEYRLVRQPAGGVALLDDSTGTRLGEFASGKRVEYSGFSFLLQPAALGYSPIRFRIGLSTAVAQQVAYKISVTQPSRDVNIVKVSYRSPDRDLAWQVPQALVNHYIAQRQELQTLEMRSTIDFLQQQIVTISTQLAESERKLETYRERSSVINPQAEATGQVTRLISMQTQLGMLEDERSSVAALLAEVDATAASHKAGQPSAYRRLLAFPNLLQSQAATGLLQSLTAAEDQQKVLLTRRTPEDSDVKALGARITELERELRAMATTYHQGITNQVRSLDSSLGAFRQQLQKIPEKELQYARLERQPKVLEGVYTMLQTRLKEAEVAVAARDPSVRIVDAAIPPLRPVWPKPVVNTLAALMCGLLLGLATAFTREYMDRAIRTRMDVRGSTGLPVLGLIPRIPRKSDKVALIAKPRGHRHQRHGPPPLIVQVEKAAPPPIGMALSISTKAGGIAEAYGVLQTNIAFSRDDAPAKTLVFTSPFSGDGKTTTVVNLGISLAQRGSRVLLIDADVRRGVLHSVFGGAREPGLSEVLKGTSSFESARRTASVGQTGTLYYLTTGKLFPGDYGLVASDEMRHLLAQVREEYDLVIVDTPPVNIITDAAVLAASADGVVLVARSGVTAGPALSYALEQLRHVRAEVLGVVLNDIDLEHDAAYDSTYKYFRGYEYSARED